MYSLEVHKRSFEGVWITRTWKIMHVHALCALSRVISFYQIDKVSIAFKVNLNIPHLCFSLSLSWVTSGPERGSDLPKITQIVTGNTLKNSVLNFGYLSTISSEQISVSTRGNVVYVVFFFFHKISWVERVWKLLMKLAPLSFH